MDRQDSNIIMSLFDENFKFTIKISNQKMSYIEDAFTLFSIGYKFNQIATLE